MPKGIKLITENGLDLEIIEIDGEQIIKVFDVAQQETEDEGNGAAPFKKLSYASETKNIQKGAINKITIRPRVLTENMQEDTNVVDTLEAGTTDIGQVFRLSAGVKDIDRLHLCLEAISLGGGVQTEENFESYADTAALRAAWAPNDIGNSPNSLETTIKFEGSKSMKCDLTNRSKSKNDNFVFTYGSSQDWSAFEGVQFQLRQDGDATLEIRIEDDNADASKHTITTGSSGVFEFHKLDFANFVPVAVTPADLTTIKKITFFVKNISDVGAFYVDIIELFEAAGGGGFGTVDIELHDFGSEDTPTQLSTILNTETLALSSGKQIYEIPFKASDLTSNNFYGIVITNSTASDVKVFGKNGSDLYENGFSFSSANDLDITSTGSGDDLCFSVFVVDKAIFNGIRFVANGGTGEGKISVFINDNASGKGKAALFLGETFFGRLEIDFPTKTQTGLGVKMTKDDIIFITYDDDSASFVTKLQATVYFTFINRPING